VFYHKEAATNTRKGARKRLWKGLTNFPTNIKTMFNNSKEAATKEEECSILKRLRPGGEAKLQLKKDAYNLAKSLHDKRILKKH
jgi:hypothetical protein